MNGEGIFHAVRLAVVTTLLCIKRRRESELEMFFSTVVFFMIPVSFKRIVRDPYRGE